MLGASDSPELTLKKIYDAEPGANQENTEEDDESDGDSVDFEAQLRADIQKEVNERLTELEKKVSIYFEEHNDKCKKDFKMYESHFLDSVNKMNTYIQEIHDGHIAEIASFKKEKDDQVIINNMFVKKI